MAKFRRVNEGPEQGIRRQQDFLAHHPDYADHWQDPGERAMVEAHYGLGGTLPRSTKEIAAELNQTPLQVNAALFRYLLRIQKEEKAKAEVIE